MILPMARKLLNPAASSSQEIKFMTLWLGTSISLSPSTSLWPKSLTTPLPSPTNS